jgi:hypothetical protein
MAAAACSVVAASPVFDEGAGGGLVTGVGVPVAGVVGDVPLALGALWPATDCCAAEPEAAEWVAAFAGA